MNTATEQKVLPNMVFVYGTLKRDGGNYSVMQEAGGSFVCSATTTQPHIMEVHGLPYLFEGSGEGHLVKGEVFCVTKPGGLERLDRLEGHPTLYERKPLRVTDGAGNIFHAWAYFYKGSRTGTPAVDEFVSGRRYAKSRRTQVPRDF